MAQDEASLIIAGSIHETQNFSGKSDVASAVLIPIDEDKKEGEEDEEGTEEVALDWWSKYFTSKDTQTQERKDAETEDGLESDEENGGDNPKNEQDESEGKTRF